MLCLSPCNPFVCSLLIFKLNSTRVQHRHVCLAITLAFSCIILNLPPHVTFPPVHSFVYFTVLPIILHYAQTRVQRMIPFLIYSSLIFLSSPNLSIRRRRRATKSGPNHCLIFRLHVSCPVENYILPCAHTFPNLLALCLPTARIVPTFPLRKHSNTFA